jgi:hypothetical protein
MWYIIHIKEQESRLSSETQIGGLIAHQVG